MPGKEGGRAISGYNRHDRLLVATLCALADAIVIGSGTLRSSAGHIWTAESQDPDFASAFATLRRTIGKTRPPLHVVITGRGDVDPAARMFQTGEVPALVVTTSDHDGGLAVASGVSRATLRRRGLLHRSHCDSVATTL